MKCKESVECVKEILPFLTVRSIAILYGLQLPLPLLPELRGEVTPGAVAAILGSNGNKQDNR